MVSSRQRIGKYIFLEEQETSALGDIWRAAELADGKIERNLLAECIAPALSGDTGFRNQFIKQSPVSTKLEHPNILRKISTSQESGDLISFYEYQEGFSLEKVMKRCQQEMNPFTVDHGLLVVSKLLSALAYAKTKHLTHGFVNPSMVMVTHEGEIKLKGFSLSSALRANNNPPALSDYYRNYVPAGMSLTADDRDRADIYGCGSILYEMMVGEVYSGGNVAGAETALDGEPIPPKIAAILVNALNDNHPGAYKDIQKMAKDMDELLFSGEYSPTTFNLAFFMHSAFRNEMEQLGEKIAAEKETNFDEGAAPAAAPQAKPAAAPPPPSEEPVARVQPPPMAAAAAPAAKSKMPMIIGAVALVAVIIIAVVMMGNKGGDDANTDLDNISKQLADEGQADAARRKKEEAEALRQQNEAMRNLLAEQSEQDKLEKKAKIEEEMAKLDAEIALKKKQQQAEKQLQAMAAEMERLKKMLEQKNQVAETKPETPVEREPIKPKPKEIAKAEDLKADTSKPETPQPKEESPKKEVVADVSTTPVAPPPRRANLKPPEVGELVLLEDEQLKRPENLSVIPTGTVPRKAVRDGVIRRGGAVYFLLRILVTEKGEVDQVKFVRSNLKGYQRNDYGMIEKATKIASKLKYSVPTKQGVPVKVWAYTSVTFAAK